MAPTPLRRTVTSSLLGVALLVVPTFGPQGAAASERATGSSTHAGSSGGAVTAAAPSPQPARPGKPTSIVAVGDSITQSTGTGPISVETPKNSWATGTDVNSVAARLGIATNQRYNLAANGNEMVDFVGEYRDGKSGGSGDVSPAPASTGLVLVEFGGNDLCADSVDQMTSVTDYRNQFKAGLAQVAKQSPTALIQVMSVPDIYNLWYIRGAPYESRFHPEPESDQAGGVNGARFYWSQSFFPCHSLLDQPQSYNSPNPERRLAVRERNKEYNAVLADECGKALRCKFDDTQLFNLTSNRASPPDGPLLPYAQWKFTDLDISRNEKSNCPLTGLSAGCGDHFHPTKQGQGKIADVAMLTSRDYSDTSYPTVTATLLPSTRPDGVQRFTAKVRFTGSDAQGLRGQEVRVHNPDGTISAWSQFVGVAPDFTVNKVGLSYVEARSLDVNGNLSASVIVPVDVAGAGAPWLSPAPTVAASGSGLTVRWTSPDDNGSAITKYEVIPYVGAGSPTAGTPVTATGTSVAVPAPPPGAVMRYRVRAVNGVGTGPESAASAATIAPFAKLDDFAKQQHSDFTMYKPEAQEIASDVAAVASGAETPSGLAVRLRSSVWFDGAYGPSIRLYRAYFLRNPDPSGLEYWAGKRRAGTTLSKISQQFAASSEFKRRYGTLSNGAFIDRIYNNVFGRNPDPSGRAYYLRKLSTGWSRGQVVLQFSESSEYERKSRNIVTVIELARGMNGKMPSATLFDSLLSACESGGSAAVFDALVSTASYRTRVIG